MNHHSSDLAPTDFQPYGPLNKHFAGSPFTTDAAVNQDVTCLPSQILALVPRWNKSMNINGSYAEVWCVPSATHVSCERPSQKGTLGTIGLFTFSLVTLCILVGPVAQSV